MERIKGFEIVEQFLDKWKADCFQWYIEQKQAYEEALEDYKNNPSEAKQLYNAGYSEDLEAKKEAFLDKNYERHPEKKMWKVPRSRYWGSEKFSYECSYNAIVHIMNEEYAEFKDRWSHVIKRLDRVNNNRSYEQVIEIELQREYERKYEKLVKDCQKITGVIKKADLRIGHASGNIEGYIYGEIGNAEIWSTLSGGIVQCLHIRFYCHKR